MNLLACASLYFNSVTYLECIVILMSFTLGLLLSFCLQRKAFKDLLLDLPKIYLFDQTTSSSSVSWRDSNRWRLMSSPVIRSCEEMAFEKIGYE